MDLKQSVAACRFGILMMALAAATQARADSAPQIRAIGSTAPVYRNAPGTILPAPRAAVLIRAIGTQTDSVMATNVSMPTSAARSNAVANAAALPDAAPLPAENLGDAMQRHLVNLGRPTPPAAASLAAPPPRQAAVIPAQPVVPQQVAPVLTYVPQLVGRLYPLTTYQSPIQLAARTHGVEEALVRAIIHAESAFKPGAVSSAGAGGLMQLMPATAARFGVSNRFDATQNINGGTAYLAWLLQRYQGDITLATAAYNAGEGAVDRHGGVPPYRETRGYVRKVATLLAQYRGLLSGMPAGQYVMVASGSPAAYARGVRIISAPN